MVDQIQNSIKSILHERLNSPLYGTLIVSWLAWNWKIVYLTLFVSEETIIGNKIDFITTNYSDVNTIVIYPIISTIIILTLIPFISNGAFYLHLKFKNWRKKIKDEIENKQLLSLEKSIAIREEIRNQEEKFEKIIDGRNAEIKILNATISSLENTTQETNKRNVKADPESNIKNIEFSKIIKSKTMDKFLEVQDELLSNNYIKKNKLKNLSEAILFDLVEVDPSSFEYVNLTEKGKEFLRWHTINSLKKSSDNMA